LNFKNLKSNQDKLSNTCPKLPVLKQNIEREYTYFTNEEITYLDYTYCVNETRLPILRKLHSNCSLFRVSFYTEIWIVNISGWYSNTYNLTERPRDCFTFTFTLACGTFHIDYLVFHKREILVDLYNKKAYIDKDPRCFVKSPTYEDWYEKIHQVAQSHTNKSWQQEKTTTNYLIYNHTEIARIHKNWKVLKGIYVRLRNNRTYSILGPFTTTLKFNTKYVSGHLHGFLIVLLILR
jgi:hypothetical protein